MAVCSTETSSTYMPDSPNKKIAMSLLTAVNILTTTSRRSVKITQDFSNFMYAAMSIYCPVILQSFKLRIVFIN